MLKISHYSNSYFLRFAHVRYVKRLYTNNQKQYKIFKLAYFLRNLHISRANNLRILTIKNAKISRLCFYMNTNIQRDFQICISVPLTIFEKKFH